MNVDLLITEVFNRKALWQQTNPHHHNRFILDKLWDEVADTLGTTKEETRTKWKGLRDNFRRELKKVMIKSSDDGTYTPSWPYYELLYFLKDQMAAGTNTIQSRTFETTTYTELSDDNDSKDNACDERKLDVKVPLRKRIKPNEDEDKILDDKKEKNMYNEKEQQKGENSDDYHFFMSLIPFVTNLSPIQKLSVRNKIQQIILDEVISNNGWSSNSNTNSNNNNSRIKFKDRTFET